MLLRLSNIAAYKCHSLFLLPHSFALCIRNPLYPLSSWKVPISGLCVLVSTHRALMSSSVQTSFGMYFQWVDGEMQNCRVASNSLGNFLWVTTSWGHVFIHEMRCLCHKWFSQRKCENWECHLIIPESVPNTLNADKQNNTPCGGLNERCPPIDLVGIWTLGSQWWHYGLDEADLQEEVGHWRRAFRLHIPAVFLFALPASCLY